MSFATVPANVIPAAEWRAYRARMFIMHMVADAGGSLVLKEEDLHDLPLGQLLFLETADAITCCYEPNPAAGLITNDGELMAAVLVHKAGGRVRLLRATANKLSGFALMVHPDPAPRTKEDGSCFDDIGLELVRLRQPVQDGEVSA